MDNNQLKPHPKPIRMIYFWSGVIATLSYRIIIIFTETQIFWIKLFWYIGTIGFVIYFIHRYQITESRAKLVAARNLDAKIKESNLEAEDRNAAEYIFKSLKVSSEKWIYIIIFVSSALALLAGIYLDFLK